MKSDNSKLQKGTGLIEVLVAILVLAVGVLGLSKIHSVLIRDGGSSNNRAIAASLAQEKIDDLHGFKWLDTASSFGEGCGNGIFCYSEIVTNAGGNELAGSATLRLPAGTAGAVTVGNTTFTRNWTVVDNTTSKYISVAVSWTDTNGDASLTLQTAILAEDPSTNAFAAANATVSKAGPKVAYTAKGVPDVIPVSIGTGNGKRETSKPLPDVSSKGYSVSSQFSAVNYESTGEQSQEDYVTLSCTCKFGTDSNTPSLTGPGNPASYLTYVGGTLKVKYPATTITKVVGYAPTLNGDPQDALCNTCCNDHHDNNTDTGTALYDPDRNADTSAAPNAFTTAYGNHKHYYFSNASTPQNGLTEVAEAVGNTYLEACRFRRTDGIYRLMQDWRLVDITVMPKDNYITSGSTALSKYQAYVQDVVNAQFKTDGGTSTAFPVKSSSSSSVLETRDLSSQTAGNIQLAARGIYVDRVFKTSAPRTLDADNYYTPLISQLAANTNILDKISFNEVNLTLLSMWESSSTSVASVTNQDIKDILASTSDYYGTYSRGMASVSSGNGGSTTVTVRSLVSNSGLTAGATRAVYSGATDYPATTYAASGTISYAGEIGIDPHDHSSSRRLSDSLTITRATGGGGTFSVSGTLQLGNYSGDLTKVTISASPTGPTCTISAPTGGTSIFNCAVSNSYTSGGTLTLSSSQTGAFIRNSSSVATCVIPAGTNAVDCGSYSVYGPMARISGTCDRGTGKGSDPCSDNKLTLTATGSGATCVTGAIPYCNVPLDASTKTWSGSITATTTSNTGFTQIGASGTTLTCTSGKTGSVSISGKGPSDSPASFAMCAR